MQFHRKTIIILIVSISSIFFSKNTFAQYAGMAQVYRQIDARQQQQQMNMQQQMMMSHYYMSDALYSIKYDFIVVMSDGTKKTISSKIYSDTTLHKDYIIFEDRSLNRSDTNRRKKIYPAQTVNISRDINPHFIGLGNNKSSPTAPVYSYGIAADSCWMFKVVTGSINLYSYLSEETDSQIFSTQSIVALQLNDGPIINFTVDNVKRLIAGDSDAIRQFDKKNYYAAIMKYNKNAAKAAK